MFAAVANINLVKLALYRPYAKISAMSRH